MMLSSKRPQMYYEHDTSVPLVTSMFSATAVNADVSSSEPSWNKSKAQPAGRRSLVCVERD